MMDYERQSQSTSQVYKSSNWSDRKRELKTTRNQRTTKSIKNIKSIDTPSDPNFNCNPASHLDCSIDAAPSSQKPNKYCDITGYEVNVA